MNTSISDFIAYVRDNPGCMSTNMDIVDTASVLLIQEDFYLSESDVNILFKELVNEL